MRSIIRFFTPLLAACGIGAVALLAPTASAAPQCTQVGPNTTQCQTNGSAQIVTSPPVINNYGGWPYWGGGGLVISLGGW
ncbi:hypothetical protein ABGB19_06835 [Mycobacterium sp. B14F4]|uniref:hypothetical protein n=1 Tax=Mycobacterium sp. B14F4 TaxID=3153565 RepID=UPI00325EC766